MAEEEELELSLGTKKEKKTKSKSKPAADAAAIDAAVGGALHVTPAARSHPHPSLPTPQPHREPAGVAAISVADARPAGGATTASSSGTVK